ncbi:MAG: coproporphyrinogen dehydrogenase HemZ [Clostridia bacterium]|nr:coproporphyrinogen dehydrogenase HemZ [Clostridia bacterium]
MILRIRGTDMQYYVQTLCLIFFPGAHFSESEKPGPEVPEIEVSVQKNEETYMVYTSMKLGAKFVEATGSAIPTEDIKNPKRLEKIAIGRAIFSAGKALLGYTNAWGILTGVRPAKVANEIIRAGAGVQKTRRILRDEYFLNPKKAALVVSVATTENRVLKKLPDNLCSVYISIPFCPSRCAYCSFISYAGEKLLPLLESYLEELEVDIRNTFSIIRKRGLKVATVYIGGGTPTVLDEKQLAALLSVVCECVDVSSLMEFTLEAGRPDTITEEKLSIAYAHGVTRVSVNPQTLNENVLKAIGRRHTVADFYRAYDLAAKSGIRDINVDLIAGLTGDSFAGFSQTLDRVLELSPSNLTVHTFAVKRASNILRENSQVYSIVGGDVTKSIEYSQLRTKSAGYIPYYMYRQKNTVGNQENVGYAKEGRESYYNIFMMEEIHTIFGVGAGAVTKLIRHDKNGKQQIQRIFTPKYPYEYLRDAEVLRNGNLEKPSFEERVNIFFDQEA